MKTEYPLTGGVTRFQITWPYLAKDHVVVLVDDTPHTHTWVSDHELSVTDPFGGPVLGTKLTIMRVTPDVENYAQITDASNLTAEQLNQMRRQLLYLIQERAGGMAGYIGAAVGAVSGDLQDITSNLDNIENILAALTADLVTLNALKADVAFAKNEAAQLRDDLLAEIDATAGQITAIQHSLDVLTVGQRDFGARVSLESVTRLTEDSALAFQIGTVDARLTTEKAALESSITQVDQARETGDAALAQRVVSLESKVDVGGSTVSALINQAATTLAAADSAQALQTQVLQASIDGAQLAINGGMVPGGLVYGNAVYTARTAAGVPQGAPGNYVAKATLRDNLEAVYRTVPVLPGETLDFTCWVGLTVSIGCAVGMVVELRDAAGTVTGYHCPNILGNFTGWKQVASAWVVPVGVAQIRLGLWIDYSGDGSKTAYFTSFSVARHSAMLAQVEQSAAASVSRLGVVESNYTLKAYARSDGKTAVAGIGLAASAGGAVAQSEIILMADRLIVTPPGDPNGPMEPLLVQGTVNGVPTTVFPAGKVGDKIVAARMLVDGAIEARHMLLVGSGGAALNLDPACADGTAWLTGADPNSTGTRTVVNVSDGAAGLTVLRTTGPVMTTSRNFPVIPGKTYKVSAWMRQVTAGGATYLRLEIHNASGTLVGYQLVGIDTGVGPVTEGITLSSAWQHVQGTIVAQAGAAYGFLTAHTNWVNGGGVADMQDVRVEEQIDYSLIVQGGIKADRIDTRGLSIKDAAGNVILAAGTALSSSYVTPAAGWLNSNIAYGGNLVYNPAFDMGMDGWSYGGGNGMSPAYSGIDLNPAWYLAGSGKGRSVLFARQDGRSGVGDPYFEYNSVSIPVTPGQRYIVSAYSGAHRCSVSVFLRGKDTSGNVTTDGNGWSTNGGWAPGGPDLASYARHVGVWDCPVGTATVEVLLRKHNTDAGFSDSWMFITRVMLEAARAGGTEASAWSGTGMDGTAVRSSNPITAGNASTYIANAAIGTAQVGVLTAGNLTVTALSNTINGGAGSGGRVVVSANKVEVYDTSNALRVKMGYLL